MFRHVPEMRPARGGRGEQHAQPVEGLRIPVVGLVNQFAELGRVELACAMGRVRVGSTRRR